MKPSDVISEIRTHRPNLNMADVAAIFIHLSHRLLLCKTNDGLRLLDQSDFREWLRELAEEAGK